MVRFEDILPGGQLCYRTTSVDVSAAAWSSTEGPSEKPPEPKVLEGRDVLNSSGIEHRAKELSCVDRTVHCIASIKAIKSN